MDLFGLESLVIAAGLIVAVATSLVKNVDFSKKVKHVIAVVVSAVATVPVALQTGDLNGTTDVLTAATAIYGISQLVYGFILKGTKVNDLLEAVGSRKGE